MIKILLIKRKVINNKQIKEGECSELLIDQQHIGSRTLVNNSYNSNYLKNGNYDFTD